MFTRTHSLSAHGFNLYGGMLQKAEFKSATTYGDGAIGMQLSKSLNGIRISDAIRTKGDGGESLD